MIKSNNHTPSDTAKISYFCNNSSDKHTDLELKKILYILDKLIELKDFPILKDNVLKIKISNQSLREYKSDYMFYATIYLKDTSYLYIDYDKDEVIIGFGKHSFIYDKYVRTIEKIKKINYWSAPSLTYQPYYDTNWKEFKNRIKRSMNKLYFAKK
jgi:hypothetical protein